MSAVRAHARVCCSLSAQSRTPNAIIRLNTGRYRDSPYTPNCPAEPERRPAIDGFANSERDAPGRVGPPSGCAPGDLPITVRTDPPARAGGGRCGWSACGPTPRVRTIRWPVVRQRTRSRKCSPIPHPDIFRANSAAIPHSVAPMRWRTRVLSHRVRRSSRAATADPATTKPRALARGFAPCSSGWTRTSNPSVNSRMLCQLSYGGMFCCSSALCRADVNYSNPCPQRAPQHPPVWRSRTANEQVSGVARRRRRGGTGTRSDRRCGGDTRPAAGARARRGRRASRHRAGRPGPGAGRCR